MPVVCVPPSLQEEIFTIFHSHAISGHVFVQVVCSWGIPIQVGSDQGSHSTGQSFTHAFCPKYKGPYPIVHKASLSVYLIQYVKKGALFTQRVVISIS